MLRGPAVLHQVEAGVASPLDIEYRRAVECHHRLPAGLRNVSGDGPNGRSWYRETWWGTSPATLAAWPARSGRPRA